MSPSGPAGTGGARPVRVAVTRPDHEANGDRLPRLLEEAGFEGLPCSLTAIEAPGDARPLLRGARALLNGEVDILLLTSARAVLPLTWALDSVALDENDAVGWTRPRRLDVWAVGTATGAAAAKAGLDPDLVPDRFSAEGILDGLAGKGSLDGKRILFPRSSEGRNLLPEELAARGATVTVVEAYRTIEREGAAESLLGVARRGEIDAVVLTAGSQARALGRALRTTVGAWPSRVPIIVIGTPTKREAIAAGLPPPTVADPHTFEGVVLALTIALRGVEHGVVKE